MEPITSVSKRKPENPAPQLCVREIELYERPVKFRMPFRFGVVTLTQAPQAFVRCRIQMADGRESWGQSAELMAPKWFDKNPELTNEDNFNQLRKTLHLYRDAILVNGMKTAFEHFASLYKDHLKTAENSGLNAIIAGYGPALIDRAVLDALCRLEELSFAQAIQANRPGIRPDLIAAGFSGFNMDEFLSQLSPASELYARHTVGMVDPLKDNDLRASDRVNDGLPETLEEVVNACGIQYFKVKVGGDLMADMDRLKKIAAVLDAADRPYQATLDGNEQYDNVDRVIELLDGMRSEPELARFVSSIILVEQPIQRKEALQRDVSALATHFPVIIDESDADLDAFPAAREMGYAGVSSKNCKGFYKSLINLARCRMWTMEDGKPYFMSAEDLTCQAGVAVQQDLALVALLGLGHVERNGHHYVKGMAGAGDAEQDRFIKAHPDLYRQVDGAVCTHIKNGKLSIGSLQCVGFGAAVEPQWDAMQLMSLV